MIRSFDYAAITALHQGTVRPEDMADLFPWAHYWYRLVSATFLRSYLEAAKNGQWLPRRPEALSRLFELFLFEKAAYELRYELNNRPTWVGIPLRGLDELIEERQNDTSDEE